MLLETLIQRIDHTVVTGNPKRAEIESICYDSRRAVPGALFVCMEGAVSDGHDYAAAAYEKGARAFLVSKDVTLPDGAVIVKTPNTRVALAAVSAAFFGDPAKELRVIGVTGTKGKTSITYMIRAILTAAGYKCGIIGTIGTFDGENYASAKNTTPESYEIQRLFAQMVRNNCSYCIMEVSSQATKLDRVACIEFDSAVFTNISPDHIGPGEHADFEEYLSCKAKLFAHAGHAFLNADDPYVEAIRAAASGTVMTYGIVREADVTAGNILLLRDGSRLGVSFTLNADGRRYDVTLGAPGRFSIYNSLAALCVAHHIGVDMENAIAALKDFHAKGRMEALKLDVPYTVIVDYAHNAVSLENVLTAMHGYDAKRIVTLFGCGGNRDRHRRFEMGEVSGRLSDLTVITSDNPRNEEPMDIIADIVKGIEPTDGKYVTIPDREEAMRWVLANARPDDIILVAGKGHEDYQEIKGERRHFDDAETLYRIAEEMGIARK